MPGNRYKHMKNKARRWWSSQKEDEQFQDAAASSSVGGPAAQMPAAQPAAAPAGSGGQWQPQEARIVKLRDIRARRQQKLPLWRRRDGASDPSLREVFDFHWMELDEMSLRPFLFLCFKIDRLDPLFTINFTASISSIKPRNMIIVRIY
ncbi:unnamed protein product [Amoebophrya sp. A25]|nr:unnamed protein product [Amoebophrya sp. A25]|eukprot:GSA25T00027095001.1